MEVSEDLHTDASTAQTVQSHPNRSVAQALAYADVPGGRSSAGRFQLGLPTCTRDSLPALGSGSSYHMPAEGSAVPRLPCRSVQVLELQYNCSPDPAQRCAEHGRGA